MTLKFHLLDTDFENFKENKEAYTEKNDKSFHQDMQFIECHHEIVNNNILMESYICGL